MSKTVLFVVLLVLVVAVGGLLGWYFLIERPNGVNDNRNGNTEVLMPPKNTVWIVNGNFTPAVVTVKAGDKITWVNKDEFKRRVASDPHPDLSALPELVSSDLAKGDSFSFSFTSKGEWGYHDFLNPIKKGKIVVQ
jgi:plastocyanin